MNKQQKEVQQAILDAEKEVLELLKKNYQDALDEINTKIAILMGREDSDMTQVMYQVVYQEALKKQVESALNTLQANEFETISDYLAKSYEDGYIGTMYDIQGQGIPIIIPMDQEQVVQAIQHETKLSEGLYKALGKDVKVLSKQIAGEITRGISSGQMYSEIARNIAGYAGISRNKAMRIARTEGHRIQCKATMDAQFKAKEKGADVVKQWDSTLDKRTRASHRKLDGQIRELDEEFEVGGNHAMMPGGFNKASEDINCRCALLQRARWALDESELETLKKRAEYFGLDKAEDFADYKKKYLKAVDENSLEKSTKSSKILSKELADDEVKALNDYMSAKSYVVNEKLRSGTTLEQEEEAFVENLEKALDKMPVYEGDLQRSLYFYSDDDVESFMSTYQVGGKVKYNEFLSTSKGKVYNPDGQVQLFIHNAKSGKDISALNSNEDEVLYKRDSTFRVLNIVEQDGKYFILVVEDYE